jgi:hypothetical protein
MPMPLRADRQAQLGHALRRHLDAMRAEARQAVLSREDAARARTERERLHHANPDLVSADMHDSAVYSWVVLSLVAVYGLDVILFAPVAEFFVGMSFPGTIWLARAAQFLLPAFIVLLEILAGLQRDRARRDRLDGLSGPASEIAWTIASVAFCLVMPAAVAATYMAGEDQFTPWVSGPLLAALLGLSLLAHVSVLFGGRLATEAKTFLAFRWRDSRLNRQMDTRRTASTRHGRRAGDLFSTYYGLLDRYNRESPEQRLEAGPFDRDTRQVVNEVYGYEVIRTADPIATAREGEHPQAVGLEPVRPTPDLPPGRSLVHTDGHEPAAEPAADTWRDYEREVRP